MMKNNSLSFYLKKYLTLILFGLGAVFIIVALVRFLPEMLSMQDEVDDLDMRSQALSQTLASVIAYGSGAQASELEIVNTALPSDKDASLIYASITNAAASYAVKIDSFSVNVGEVYVSDSGNSRDDTLSELTVVLDVTSPSSGNTLQFVQALYRSLPVTQIDGMKLVDGRGQMTLTYYYKGDPGNITGGAIQPVGGNEKSVYDQISGWERP